MVESNGSDSPAPVSAGILRERADRLEMRVSELEGRLQALTLAVRGVEEAAVGYFDRAVRVRKASDADRRVMERLVRDNRCADCRSEMGEVPPDAVEADG